MCGICGFTWEDKQLVKSMSDIMSYRGPDDSGIYTDSHVSLSHRRLSIIDLSKNGRQPMSNENGDIFIIFNGEIYNFKELRTLLEGKHRFSSNTDTEAIIHGYEEFGPNIFKKLNGMFAIAIWDLRKRQLILARDRIGIKPLYYAIVENNLIFASEIKSLLQHKTLKRKINMAALNSFLTYRFIASDDTILKGIKKLMPGHLLVYSRESIQLKKFWDMNFSIENMPESHYINEFRELMLKSVNSHLMSDVPLGTFLSGGIDSSAIVAINSQIRDDAVKTFTIGFNHSSDEFKYARMVADKFGTDHKEIALDYSIIRKELPKIIWHMDEPNTDITMVPLYFLSRESRKKATVINTGEGADELFAGYYHYKVGSPLLSVVPDKVKASIYSWYYSPFKGADRKQLFRMAQPKDIVMEQLLQKKTPSDLLNKILLFDIKHELPNWQLTRVDRMTMAHSQEARVPFLENDIIDFSARLPTNMKIKNLDGKYLMAKAFSDILPKEILKRPKQGFTTPMFEWIKEDLYSEIENTLSKDNTYKRRIFRYSYINNLQQKFKRIKKQKPFELTSYRLLILYFLESWMQMYLDERKMGQ